MRWKLKAAIQNLLAKLPDGLSYATHYQLQRHLGGLKHTDPTSRLRAGLRIVELIEDSGRTVDGATCLEIGTGRQLNLPLALWLCGAAEVVTVDLNPYLKAELVESDLGYLREHRGSLEALWGRRGSDARFQERLMRLVDAATDLDGLLAITGIRPVAPADATNLGLASHTIDYHVSYTVFEHIAPPVLSGILTEGKRLLKPDGLFVHLIDHSDHFSHSDSSISTVNFLQFSPEEWQRYAGNRYMYQNRLRVDDCLELFREVGLEIHATVPKIDERSLEVLRGSFPLHSAFRGKSEDDLATSSTWIVASSASPSPRAAALRRTAS